MAASIAAVSAPTVSSLAASQAYSTSLPRSVTGHAFSNSSRNLWYRYVRKIGRWPPIGIAEPELSLVIPVRSFEQIGDHYISVECATDYAISNVAYTKYRSVMHH